MEVRLQAPLQQHTQQQPREAIRSQRQMRMVVRRQVE